MKIAKIALFLLLISFCAEDSNLSIENNEDEVVENNNNNQEDSVGWNSALGKSPEIFVSTWNSVVDSISDDEETILFFSINPDEVKWTSTDKDQLVYKWGDASNEDNVFILNLYIENEIVRTVQFFAPTTNDTITTQQTKLFLLLIIALSDDQLDRDGRENILSGLGLYEEINDPNEYGGILVFNEIEYEIEPLVQGSRLVGLNFYSRLTLK
tara:strand:- start:477 stop:1112 length:636 start_codon:yes stop_codon:yes gene_type:complete